MIILKLTKNSERYSLYVDKVILKRASDVTAEDITGNVSIMEITDLVSGKKLDSLFPLQRRETTVEVVKKWAVDNQFELKVEISDNRSSNIVVLVAPTTTTTTAAPTTTTTTQQ